MSLQVVPRSIFHSSQETTVAQRPGLKAYQIQKVMAVALGCLAFFTIQFGLGLAISAGIGLGCATITLCSEQTLRTDPKKNIDWLRPSPFKQLIPRVALHALGVILYAGLTTAAGVVPIQAVAALILAKNLKVILIATLIAPITEEILYRGFIQERLEDVATLIDRHICRLKTTTKERCSAVVQALLFGAMHTVSGQVVGLTNKVITCLTTALTGYYLTHLKNKHKSLLSSITFHSAHNTGIVLGMLAGSQYLPKN
jgi:membrane protease YdiL (CAAX protease family)